MQIKDQPEGVIIRLIGALNARTCADLAQQFKRHNDLNTNYFILDFSETISISSAGLRIILDAYSYTHRPYKIILCDLNKHLKDLMIATGFTRLLTIFPDAETALSCLADNEECGATHG